MILVDTSIGGNHLRVGSLRLTSFWKGNLVLLHPYVIGELTCGMLKNRTEILGLMQTLPEACIAEHHEVLHLLESHKLFGTGLGWVDISLLASVQLTGCGLWTNDGSLQKAARKLGIHDEEHR